MFTLLGTVAAASDAISIPEAAIVHLDPDTAELIAEVDAILCAALAPARRPPAPPATASSSVTPRSAGWSWRAPIRPWCGPVHPVRAVERSPPASRTARSPNISRCERQVMASQ